MHLNLKCMHHVIRFYNICFSTPVILLLKCRMCLLLFHLIQCCFPADYVEDVDLLVRRAERCLEAGADMIMIDADDLCRHADSVRGDLIAKIIGRLGLEKTMFEASSPQTSEWFVKQYGPKVLGLLIWSFF